jgi:SAM-dependent methyltransferase
MIQDSLFEAHADEYDAWFDRYPNVYESELLAVRAVLPPRSGRWVEIGVGSGRFASRLGIGLGIEPSQAMAHLARARGITVLSGRAEELPLGDASMGAAFLITTVCFLGDLRAPFAEIQRVLQPGGSVVVAFIPLGSPFGRLYRADESRDPFFTQAQLRSPDEIKAALAEAGFHADRTMQTLTGDPAEADRQVEVPSVGSDRGSFVVMRAGRGDRGPS